MINLTFLYPIQVEFAQIPNFSNTILEIEIVQTDYRPTSPDIFVPKYIDYSLLLPNEIFKNNPAWSELANAITDIFNIQIDIPIQELSVIRNPVKTERNLKILHSKMLGFDWNSDLLSDQTYELLGRFISIYNGEKGPSHWFDFLGFILNTKFMLRNLWTLDYINFIPDYELTTGKTVLPTILDNWGAINNTQGLDPIPVISPVVQYYEQDDYMPLILDLPTDTNEFSNYCFFLDIPPQAERQILDIGGQPLLPSTLYFPTTHVGLEYDALNFPLHTESNLSILFYKTAPAQLVLWWIAAVYDFGILDLYVSTYMTPNPSLDLLSNDPTVGSFIGAFALFTENPSTDDQINDPTISSEIGGMVLNIEVPTTDSLLNDESVDAYINSLVLDAGSITTQKGIKYEVINSNLQAFSFIIDNSTEDKSIIQEQINSIVGMMLSDIRSTLNKATQDSTLKSNISSIPIFSVENTTTICF